MKKNQVDKHANRCRSCYAVTCVDCSVTFYGNDYATHLVCVSEAEKYEKTLYKAKIVTKLNPQEAWLSLIADAASKADEAPRNIRSYVLRLNTLGNVPRNKSKFSNFMKNSVKINNASVIDDLWAFLEGLKSSRDIDGPAIAATEAVTECVIENAPVDTSDVEKDAKRIRKAERKRLKEISTNDSGTCENNKQHGT
jgi:cell growth-regulating nucleolar protein